VVLGAVGQRLGVVVGLVGFGAWVFGRQGAAGQWSWVVAVRQISSGGRGQHHTDAMTHEPSGRPKSGLQVWSLVRADPPKPCDQFWHVDCDDVPQGVVVDTEVSVDQSISGGDDLPPCPICKAANPALAAQTSIRLCST